jgi:hypothetical protein
LWYEEKESGLGSRLRDEVAHIVNRVAEDQVLWREREGGFRRVNCPVLPYFIAYIIREQKVIVVAVGHGHRKPNFWKSRLG